jgi:hypothetical protein
MNSSSSNPTFSTGKLAELINSGNLTNETVSVQDVERALEIFGPSVPAPCLLSRVKPRSVNPPSSLDSRDSSAGGEGPSGNALGYYFLFRIFIMIKVQISQNAQFGRNGKVRLLAYFILLLTLTLTLIEKYCECHCHCHCCSTLDSP